MAQKWRWAAGDGCVQYLVCLHHDRLPTTSTGRLQNGRYCFVWPFFSHLWLFLWKFLGICQQHSRRYGQFFVFNPSCVHELQYNNVPSLTWTLLWTTYLTLRPTSLLFLCPRTCRKLLRWGWHFFKRWALGSRYAGQALWNIGGMCIWYLCYRCKATHHSSRKIQLNIHICALLFVPALLAFSTAASNRLPPSPQTSRVRVFSTNRSKSE